MIGAMKMTPRILIGMLNFPSENRSVGMPGPLVFCQMAQPMVMM